MSPNHKNCHRKEFFFFRHCVKRWQKLTNELTRPWVQQILPFATPAGEIIGKMNWQLSFSSSVFPTDFSSGGERKILQRIAPLRRTALHKSSLMSKVQQVHTKRFQLFCFIANLFEAFSAFPFLWAELTQNTWESLFRFYIFVSGFSPSAQIEKLFSATHAQPRG